MTRSINAEQRHEDIVLAADVTVGQYITAHDPATGRALGVRAGCEMRRGERVWIDCDEQAWPRQWVEHYRVGTCGG